MTNLVFDGTGPPRFLICGDDYVSNGDFEELDALDEWTFDTSNLNVQTLQSSNTNYGLYVLAVAGMSPESVGDVQCTVDFEEDIQDEQIVVSFCLWSAEGATVRVQLTANSDTVIDEVFEAPDQQKLFVAVSSSVPSSTQTATIKFTFVGDSLVELDRVQARILQYDIVLPVHQEGINFTYEKEVSARYTLLDGSEKEYVLGWRFRGSIEYVRLSPTEEVHRSRIAEASYIFFFPHNDNDFVVPVKWDKEFERRYPQNVQVGYQAVVPLVGIELLTHIPKS